MIVKQESKEILKTNQLKSVEIDPEVSHEHEFNCINSFKEILGSAKHHLPCQVIYLTDGADDIVEDIVTLTWYDDRGNHPTHTEYRLYYPESDCFSTAKPEDLLTVCENIITAQVFYSAVLQNNQ